MGDQERAGAAVGRAGPAMVVGALGIVFGDIGTSPLYTLHAVLGEAHDLSDATVYGLTSLVVWSLVVVVTVLYVGLLMRADNEGEGGLLSLVALLRRTSMSARLTLVVTALGMLGAAMFLGDSVITPSISVLSAAEGLEVVDPSLDVVVLPIALVLLVAVFAVQKYGTGRIGRAYGPVMLLWFAILAVTGIASLAREPAALQALSPTWAARFVLSHPLTGFLSLGSVVLAITGAEALYADLGHFGRSAISRAWLLVVLPALVLGYLGEGAAVIRDHGASDQPFYAVVPGWATVPVLVVATMATVIASQAVISGAFTVLHQAAGLGIFPWLAVRHTSRTTKGQIYLPAANWSLAVVVLTVVTVFRSSDRLSAAYGVAVSTTILVSATLYLVLQRRRAGRRVTPLALGAICWLAVLAFVAAAGPKLLTGGWLPVALGVVLVVVMSSWWSGQRRLRQARQEQECSIHDVLAQLGRGHGLLRRRRAGTVHRVPGSAVFTTHGEGVAPLALQALIRQGHLLPEHVVLLTWSIADTPKGPRDDTRLRVDPLGNEWDGVVAVSAVLGYRERPDVERILREALAQDDADLEGFELDDASYYVSVPLPQLSRPGHLARWRQRVFLVLHRLSTDPVDRLKLPRDRTVTIGRELEL